MAVVQEELQNGGEDKPTVAVCSSLVDLPVGYSWTSERPKSEFSRRSVLSCDENERNVSAFGRRSPSSRSASHIVAILQNSNARFEGCPTIEHFSPAESTKKKACRVSAQVGKERCCEGRGAFFTAGKIRVISGGSMRPRSRFRGLRACPDSRYVRREAQLARCGMNW